MKFEEIYGEFEKIDLENKSPLKVLTGVYDIVKSVNPIDCAHSIKECMGLYIRDCDSNWQPTEKKKFDDDVYGALKKNIDLEIQTPFNVITTLYEIMDSMGTITPINVVQNDLERYLRENKLSSMDDN